MLRWVSPMIFYVIWLMGSINCETQPAIPGIVDPDTSLRTTGVEPTVHGFFPLKICHVSLFEDYGDLFSPVFLGSNPPPIWCNWTIVADQGKQIILHLYHFASKENCDMNEDQIIFEELPARMEPHTLSRCWSEEFYTSQSNILYVFWLSMGNPSISNGGFYGNYEVFDDEERSIVPTTVEQWSHPLGQLDEKLSTTLFLTQSTWSEKFSTEDQEDIGNTVYPGHTKFYKHLTIQSETEYLESYKHDQHPQRITTPTAMESEEQYLENEHDQHSQSKTTPNVMESEAEYSDNPVKHSQRITTPPNATESGEEYFESYKRGQHATENETEYLENYKHDQHSQRITTPPNATESETIYIEKYKPGQYAEESEKEYRVNEHNQHSQSRTTPNVMESEAEYSDNNRDKHSQRVTTPPNAMESETKYIEKYKPGQYAEESEKEYRVNEHDQHSQRITLPNATESEEEYFESYQHATENETEYLENYKHDQHSQRITTPPTAMESEEQYLENEHNQHSQSKTTPNVMGSEAEYLDNNPDKHSQRITTPPNAMESGEEYFESYKRGQHATENETEYLENYKHDQHSQRITTPPNATESETIYIEKYKPGQYAEESEKEYRVNEHNQHSQSRTTPNVMESEAEYSDNNRDKHSQRVTTPPNAMESETKYIEKYKPGQYAEESEKEYRVNEHDQHSQRITLPNATESEEEYFESYQRATENETEYLENYKHDQHSQRITTPPTAMESEEQYLENEHNQHSQSKTTPNVMGSEAEYLDNNPDKHSQRITTPPNAMESGEEYFESYKRGQHATENETEYLENYKHDQHSQRITTPPNATESETIYIEKYKPGQYAEESEKEYRVNEHNQHSQSRTTPNVMESEAEYSDNNRDKHSQRVTTPPNAMESETKYIEKYKPGQYAEESEKEYRVNEHNQHSQSRTTPNVMESEAEYSDNNRDKHSQRVTTPPNAMESENKYIEKYKPGQYAEESEKEYRVNEHDQHSQRITLPNATESEEEYFESYQRATENETEYLENYKHDQHSQRITTPPTAMESEEQYLENEHNQHSQSKTTPNVMGSEAEYLDNNPDKHSQRITTPPNASESEEEYFESYKRGQHATENETEYLENSKHDQQSQRITTPTTMESETEYVENGPDQHPHRITPNAMEKEEYRANYKNVLHAMDNEVEYQENSRQHSQLTTSSNAKENEEEHLENYKHGQYVMESKTEFLNYEHDQDSQRIATINAIESEEEYLENSNLFAVESEMEDLKNSKPDQYSQEITTPNAIKSEDKYIGKDTDYHNGIASEPVYIKNYQHPQRITTQNAVGSEEENLENDRHVIASFTNQPFLQTTPVNDVQDTSLLRPVHFDTFLSPLQSKLPEIQSEAFDFADLDTMAALDLSGDLEPTRVPSFSLKSKMFLGMYDTSSEERFVVDAQPLNKAWLEDIDGVCNSCDSSRVSVVGTSGKDVAESLHPTLLFANKLKQSETFADKSNSASYLPISTANYLNTFESNQAIKKIHNTMEVSQVVLQSRFESLDGGEDNEISPILTNGDSNYNVNGDQTGYVAPALLEEDSEINQQLKFTTPPSESTSSLKQDGIEVQIQAGKLWTNAAWEESIGTTDGSSINRNAINSFAEKRVDGASPLEPLHEDPTSIARALNFSVDKISAYRSHRNVTPLAHFPGEHLFEVSIEMQINLTGKENLKDLERTLLTLLENLIKDDLKDLHPPKSITLKRVKRLKSGLMFILWLHFGFGERSMHVSLQSCLQRLVNRPMTNLGIKNALVSSVSTEDVNECGTEMLLCDAHADCFNEFGTYTCQCQEGFEDWSRAGSGGTICVNVAGSRSHTLLETLTGFGFVLIVFLLFFMFVLAVYKRQQQGTFVVRCENLESAVLQQCLQTHGCGLHQKDDLVEPREGLPLTQFKYFCGSERIGDGMSGNTQGDDVSVDERAMF